MKSRVKYSVWIFNWNNEQTKSDVPMEIFGQGLKIPLQGSEKIPCKYSARGAKIQLRFSHSADQGKITNQVLPQVKFVVIQKVKSRDDECKNKQARH